MSVIQARAFFPITGTAGNRPQKGRDKEGNTDPPLAVPDLRGAAVCVTGDRAPLPGRPLGWDQHGPKAEKDRKNNSEAIRQM